VAQTSTNALWSGQAHMPSVSGSQVTIVSGKGAWLTTDDGRTLLDGAGVLWHANVGHGREEIAKAAYDQMCELETHHVFGRFLNRPAVALANRLAALAPMGDPRVILTSGGSDSVDVALKLARRHWQLAGRTSKTVVLSRDHGYHGLHAFGTSVGGLAFNREGYGTPSLIPETARVSHDRIDDVSHRIAEIGPENIAAIIAEPVMGTGGVYPPPLGYFEGLQDLCRRHEILLVLDEVITGFGRVGAMFAAQRYGFEPDMVVFAKGVTSGYAPLGGVLVSPRVWQPFFDGDDAPVFRHGLTYSGHATGCAVAMKNLDILESERLPERVLDLENVLSAELEALRGCPGVTDVRYAGLMGGVELTPEVDGDKVVRYAEEHGVIIRNLPRNVIMMSPPLVVTDDELASIPRVVGAALRALA
jgi:adenosylmethionine-8-amino-7-oxononanoate aminotransferase